MSVARTLAIIGSSPNSWNDAINEAMERANKTLRNIRGLEVTKMNAHIKNGKISEYRAHVKITFVLEG